jgi:hypothetical protein
MKISVRGWSRDMGKKEIMSCELMDLKYSQNPNKTVYRDKDPLIFESGLGVEVAWHQNLRFVGDYRMTVNFSRTDVVRLFKLVFGNELDASVLDRYGFTVSDDLKKAVLRTIKLSDVTIADLAAMSSPTENTFATAETLAGAGNVRSFPRRV